MTTHPHVSCQNLSDAVPWWFCSLELWHSVQELCCEVGLHLYHLSNLGPPGPVHIQQACKTIIVLSLHDKGSSLCDWNATQCCVESWIYFLTKPLTNTGNDNMNRAHQCRWAEPQVTWYAPRSLLTHRFVQRLQAWWVCLKYAVSKIWMCDRNSSLSGATDTDGTYLTDKVHSERCIRGWSVFGWIARSLISLLSNDLTGVLDHACFKAQIWD